MIKKYADAITSILLEENIITEDNWEIYQFGIERIIRNVAFILVISLISTIFNVWLETVGILIGFVPLRKIAGGYHSETLLRCSLLTFFIYIFNMIIISVIKNDISIQAYVILCLFAMILIFMFAPVDNKNFLFTISMERKRRKYGLAIVLIITLISSYFVFIQGKVNVLSLSTMMGVLTVSVSIFIGSIKRRREKDEEITKSA